MKRFFLAREPKLFDLLQFAAPCVDKHPKKCPAWAAKGECRKNREYMEENCWRSCSQCKFTTIKWLMYAICLLLMTFTRTFQSMFKVCRVAIFFFITYTSWNSESFVRPICPNWLKTVLFFSMYENHANKFIP